MRRWMHGLSNKFKVAGVLAFLLCMVLIVNLVERRQMNILEQSFSAMYEDRLMAESYLLEMSEIIHTKEDLAASAEKAELSSVHRGLNASLNDLLLKYEKTRLTREEEVLFLQFKTLLGPVFSYDNQTDLSESEKLNYLGVTRKATSKLMALSHVQTKEGGRLISESNNIIMNQRSTSHFEIVILLFLGAIIQTLVLSSSLFHERVKNFSNLN